MESQPDIVDLTINDDDDCLFPTELNETELFVEDGWNGRE